MSVFSSPERNVLGVSYCDGPVLSSVMRCPQFASNDITITTGRISLKVDKIVSLEFL